MFGLGLPELIVLGGCFLLVPACAAGFIFLILHLQSSKRQQMHGPENNEYRQRIERERDRNNP